VEEAQNMLSISVNLYDQVGKGLLFFFSYSSVQGKGGESDE
jgi:hypothetical protein